jgi:hypothetical protein
MVNGLTFEQIRVEQALCHEYVLEHARTTGGSRMTRCAQPAGRRDNHWELGPVTDWLIFQAASASSYPEPPLLRPP